MTSMPSGIHPARRRDPQPGKGGALQHGFYSELNRLDPADLQTAFQVGLANEIALLRVSMRRVADLSQGIDDIDTATATLNTLAAAAGKLAGLLRTEKLLTGSNDSTSVAISQALAEVIKDLKLA